MQLQEYVAGPGTRFGRTGQVKRTIAAMLLLAAGLYAAGFQDGLDAYNRGDYAAALKEWQPLAEAGEPHSEYNLGLMYARGQGVPQDYQKACDWYRKAAEKGVAAAQYNLGVIYANGQGVKANPQEAAQWFLKAAGQGITAAEVGLGRSYYEEGAFRNYGEAGKWYQKAADQGVASAAFDLGVMYDVGQGVPQNYDEALKWYHKAADAGYAAAYTNIGILYYNGQGVKRDVPQSYIWFAKALKLGDPRANDLAPTTAKKLKPGDLKKAEKELAAWQPPPKPQAPATPTNLFMPEPVTTPATTPVATPAGAGAALRPEMEQAPEKEWSAVSRTVTPGAAAPDNPGKPAPPVAGGPSSLGNPVPEQQPDEWHGIQRVVAVGDVHGDYEQFVKVLQSADLIDNHGDWVGGKAHLVQTGDLVDRGPDTRAVLDLVMKLEKQAAAAGGGVHCLIGNHEAMDLYGDLRYVSPAEFAAFRTDGNAASTGIDEMHAAFGPDGIYGKWLRSQNAIIKIDGTVFVHAGLGPKYADLSLHEINAAVRGELNDLSRLHGGMVTDPDGPLWYTGLATGEETKLEPLVAGLLKHFAADRIVIGQYADGAVTPRFGDKVILIDIGLSRVYDNVGRVGCLEIDGGHAYALHRGRGLELPKNEGDDMLRYLRQAAALDPAPSPLQSRIASLESTVAEPRPQASGPR